MKHFFDFMFGLTWAVCPGLPKCLLFGIAIVMVPHVQASEIHIGSSAALSGPAAALGTRYHAGAKAYFSKLNRQGGINGAKVVVDQHDDGYEPSRAEVNTKNLLEDAHVVALFGYVGTPTSNVALPYVRREKIAFVGAFTGAAILRDPADRTVFNIRASYGSEANHMAAAMKAGGIKTLNVLYQFDTFGRSGLEAMKMAAQQSGIKIVETSPVERNTTNVEDNVESLVTRSSSDAIFMVSTYGTCAAFIRMAREKNFKGRFYTLSFAGLEPLRASLNGKMKGVTVAQVVPNPNDGTLAVVAEYQAAMRESGDGQFDSISLEGYLSARTMADGLRRSKTPITRASVIKGLESLGNMDLGGFRVNISPTNHSGSTFVELVSDR